MEFFKNEHAINKLKEDAVKLDMTMNYLDERLDNPCDIKSIEKCWPAEKLLQKEINDIMLQRIEMEKFMKHSHKNGAEIKVFREATAHFVQNMDAQLNDFHSHFMKYSMKPMNREPIPNGQEHVMESLGN